MRTAFKIIFLITFSFIIALMGLLLYFHYLTKDVRLDESKLVNLQRTVSFFDSEGELFSKEVNGQSVSDIKLIPKHTKDAFVSIEDKRFYTHNGIDVKGLARAMLNNVKSFSFKEGASTISQQLIKNTHLTNEKTLKRKIQEIKLSIELEKKFSKDEIIEKYLNTIFFGNNCYGIANASAFYFDKKVEDLTVNESAALAGVIKAPSSYSPLKNYEKFNDRKNVVLKEMFSQGYIDENTYQSCKKQDVKIKREIEQTNEFDFLRYARSELNKIIEKTPYNVKNFKVYTSLNKKAQEDIQNLFNESDIKSQKSAVLLDKTGRVIAYYSTCGNANRQLGSTIKPLLVYAPAIELNVVNQASLLLDEKTNFNGYCPSNYNDKYYGYVSVKESLAKSSNVCAVKLLNYTGIEKSKKFIKNTSINLTNNDDSLCIALGSSEKGTPLIDLTNAYCVFNNKGVFSPYSFIDKIVGDNGKIVYMRPNANVKIFSEDTISIMNDMLKYTVTNGTSKKLSNLPFPVYAKTGTVGSDKGNTDAYSISYTSNHVLGVWFGSFDDSLLANNVTGGTAPTTFAYQVLSELYKNDKPNEISLSKNVEEIYIDKISYEDDKKIILADSVCPERYKLKILIKKNNLPNEVSTRFSSPKIKTPKLTVNERYISIELCQTQLIKARIYKQVDGVKNLIYDSKDSIDNVFIDKDLLPNKTYVYSVIPYVIFDSKEYLGEEIFLNKIKTPKENFGDNWWKNDLE